MATLVRPLRDEERGKPNVVKAVLDLASDALYFTRADVPFSRDGATVRRWAHQGLYGYRRHTLLRLAALAPRRSSAPNRWSSSGRWRTGSGSAASRPRTPSIGVDTPEDLERAEALLRGGPGGD